MTAHEIANRLLQLPEDTVVMFLNEKERMYERITNITCTGNVKNIQRIENASEVGLTPEQEQSRLKDLKHCAPSMWAIINLITAEK